MSNKRFIDLTPITAPRAGDVLAVDNSGSGSAQIPVEDAVGGLLLKSAAGVALTGADSNSKVVISFGATLSPTPTRVEIQLSKLDAAPDMPIGVVVKDSISATQFAIQLQGMLSDGTSYFVDWKAFQ